MTNVSPSNLKLIGRATFLILSHVTDMVARAALPFRVEYADANRILHMSIAFVRTLHEVAAPKLLTVVCFSNSPHRACFFTHSLYYFNRFAVASFLYSIIWRAAFFSTQHIFNLANVNFSRHSSTLLTFSLCPHQAERARVEAGGAPNAAAHQIAEVALAIVVMLESAASAVSVASAASAASAAASAAASQVPVPDGFELNQGCVRYNDCHNHSLFAHPIEKNNFCSVHSHLQRIGGSNTSEMGSRPQREGGTRV